MRVSLQKWLQNRFDEYVDLSTTYLGSINIKREDIGRGKFSNLRARFCYRKSIKRRGMSDFI